MQQNETYPDVSPTQLAAIDALLRGATITRAVEEGEENPAYLREQLITYIGNKRSLLGAIETAVQQVCARTGKDRLRVADAFAGSGIVSRMMRKYAASLVSNDIEDYARVVAECYLTNANEVPLADLRELISQFNFVAESEPVTNGFIRRLYAPRDEAAITPEDRVFYTIDNAQRLDTYRALIETAPEALRAYLLGPLLSAASVHANTAGVFKGFYKERGSGKGKFGGTGADALNRITAPITMKLPVLSRFNCETEVLQMNSNELAGKLRGCDFAYFDPPYNQHPYGSNYFMLNLLVRNEEPSEISAVSGIPANWQRSDYNVRSKAPLRLFELLEEIDSQFVLLSYNSEGFVAPEELREVLHGLGRVDEVQLNYNTYRGSRNLRDRPIHVTEHLYLLEKGA